MNSPSLAANCSSRARLSGSTACWAAAVAWASAAVPETFMSSKAFCDFAEVVGEHDVAPLDLAAQVVLLGKQDLIDDGVLVAARRVGAGDRAVARLLVEQHAGDQQHPDRGRRNQPGVEVPEDAKDAKDAEHAASHPCDTLIIPGTPLG